jgi:hypothetical protein
LQFISQIIAKEADHFRPEPLTHRANFRYPAKPRVTQRLCETSDHDIFAVLFIPPGASF